MFDRLIASKTSGTVSVLVPASGFRRLTAAGGSGARAPADQLHAQAASLTVEPSSPGCHRFVMGAPLAGGGQLAVFHKGLPDRALEGENPCLTISSSPSARRTASGCSAWARCRSWFTPS